MLDVKEYFRSVEWIWLSWLGSALGLIALTVLILRRRRGLSLAAVLRDEDGAAYSLSYIMTLPIYILLVCVVVETTLLLIAKMGTVYAAYAAARCTIVYRSLDSSSADTTERTRRAAVRAMVPFASADRLHADGTNHPGAAEDAANYSRAARRYAAKLPGNNTYLRDKYLYADKALQVSADKKGPAFNDLVEATVTYQVPLHVPGVGRLFGTRSPRGGRYYIYEIHSKVALPDEEPQSKNRRIGIKYDPPPK